MCEEKINVLIKERDLAEADLYCQFPKLKELFKYLEKYPFMQKGINKIYHQFGNVWAKEFNNTLTTLFENHAKFESAIEGYVSFALESMKLQKHFEAELEYRHKSFDEVAASVYYDKSYMENKYLPGLLLSHYLWVHHYRQKLFFENCFLPEIKLIKPSFFYDVGVGTGFYSRLMLQHCPDIIGKGFDISESSRFFALNQVNRFNFRGRYQIQLKNILTEPPQETAKCIISVEVLEHLEDPLLFLNALCNLLSKGGKAFVTAALNAASEDHIYLYRRAEEVCAQCVQAGFYVEQYQFCSAYTPIKFDIPVPEVIALILQRR